MDEAQELKKKKEDYRVEIRKNKQLKTFQANRARLSTRLFEEESLSTSSSSNNYVIQPFTFNSNQNQVSDTQQQQLEQQARNNIFGNIIPNSNSMAKNNQKDQEQLQVCLNQFIQDTRSLENRWIAGDNGDLISANQMLSFYGNLFKESLEKNVAIFESYQVHIRLFEHLQSILRFKEKELQNNEHLAEELLSKVFQFLVNTCLHSETALNDCFSLKMIDYFINVMISSTFLAKKSKIIIYSVTLLDHIAARGVETHLNALKEKEVVRSVITLMNDIQTSLPADNDNNLQQLDIFHMKLLVHLSNFLSNISLNRDCCQEPLKSSALESCEKLLMWTTNLLNQRSKQQQQLSDPSSASSSSLSNKHLENLDTQDTPLNEGDSAGTEYSMHTSIQGKLNQELGWIETNLGSCILNIVELMEHDERDIYLGEHVDFIVFAEQQIPSADLHTSDNYRRILIYADFMNGLLLGDKEQIDLVIETYDIFEYITYLLYSSFPALVSAGLDCYQNILMSSSKEQFSNIYERDPTILERMLEIIQNYAGNTQLTINTLQALAVCIDSASKKVINSTLKPTNIINIIIMKMDPDQDQGIIKSSLCLLESLLLSEKNNDDEGDDEEEEEEEMGDEEDEKNNDEDKEECEEEEELYWARKFKQNPAGQQMITRLFGSRHSQDIILKLDSIEEDYLNI